jgi:hypothetical protein
VKIPQVSHIELDLLQNLVFLRHTVGYRPSLCSECGELLPDKLLNLAYLLPHLVQLYGEELLQMVHAFIDVSNDRIRLGRQVNLIINLR